MTANDRDIVFYDGHCGFCDRTVQFILRHDPAARFLFAPLQGAASARFLPKTSLPDSVLVLPGGPSGTLLTKAAACRYLASFLGWPWSWLAVLTRALPNSFLDSIYDFVALRRKRYFTRPSSCPAPPTHWTERFIP